MWAALTEDVEGAPADDYPEDIDIDSTDTEQLAKKRDWHVEWLQAVISYYSTSQQDSVYDAIRQHVTWTGSKDKPTRTTIAEWALACARAEKAVAPEAWSAADPKLLFAACVRVLPEAVRTLLQQNKPEGGQHTWRTAAKFLNQRKKRTMLLPLAWTNVSVTGRRGPIPALSRKLPHSSVGSCQCP